MEHEESVTFFQKDLKSTSFAFFEDMRKNEQFCDITVHAGNASFVAHKLILAAAIPYFRSKFTSHRSVSKEEEINMRNMNPRVLEAVICFAYTGQICITSENAQPLLVASEIFQVIQLKDACVKFLSERLDLNNIDQVRKFAYIRNNLELLQSTVSCIRQNFAEFSKSDYFLRLPYPVVREIISEDDLRISKEEIAFDAVMNWVKFLPSERKDFLPDLLSEVRMVHLNIHYLNKKVASEELIRFSAPNMVLIQNAQSYHLLTKEESSVLNLKTQPRTLGYYNNGIYALCHTSSLGYSVYYCDLIGRTWKIVKSEELELGNFLLHTVAINDSIYLFSKERLARFHLKFLKWEILNPSLEFIGGATVASHNNMIYILGGCTSDGNHSRVLCFDTRENKWLEEEKMTRRSFCSAASLQEWVYVTGGRNENAKCINSVEKYKPATRQWSLCSPMLHHRAGHGCASLNGKIYVRGGYDGSSFCCASEVFDPSENQWKLISLKGVVLGQCRLIPHINKIFAFPYRRCHNKNLSDGFEFYDTKTGQWSKCSFSAPPGFLSTVLLEETHD